MSIFLLRSGRLRRFMFVGVWPVNGWHRSFTAVWLMEMSDREVVRSVVVSFGVIVVALVSG